MYVPPFELLKGLVDVSAVKGELRVTATYKQFVEILKLMLVGIKVDEAWYLKQYEDIAEAIKAGIVQSPQQHFIDDGYFEGRLPGPMVVDEKWYLEAYPDVADGIRAGTLTSAQAHFERDGYKEGRRPFGPSR